jgi:hypothetical protein
MTSYPVLPLPSSDDVAKLLRARTKDLAGDELGVFNANTRPTDADVAGMLELAYNEVTGTAGAYLDPRCAALANSLVVIRAAMWVEASYWPEQVRSDRSIYTELAEQYTAGMPTLLDCVAGNLPAGAEGGLPAAAPVGFGMVNVHGWASVPAPFGVPDPPV